MSMRFMPPQCTSLARHVVSVFTYMRMVVAGMATEHYENLKNSGIITDYYVESPEKWAIPYYAAQCCDIKYFPVGYLAPRCKLCGEVPEFLAVGVDLDQFSS